MKREIKKVKKLLKSGYIPFMDGEKIRFLVKGTKEYKPKYELLIIGG